MQEIEWTAEQVCGECGEGVFAHTGELAICTVCGHEHPMDPVNLGEGERFEWRYTCKLPAFTGTLHVVAVA